jgi:2-polyprenyl-3-methyl-5-hydroxy-6-metoxy-1,4-benzoquinol methylase
VHLDLRKIDWEIRLFCFQISCFRIASPWGFFDRQDILTTIAASAGEISPHSLKAAVPEIPATGKTRKINARHIAGSIAMRALHPAHVWRAIQLHRGRKASRRSFDNASLELYSRILPGEFLHYGYFDDVDRKPEQISLDDIITAQNRYAELLLDLIGTPPGPVLDVGCGIGGLTRMLLGRGFQPVALTPDRLQAAYVNKAMPDVPVLRCKFEALPVEEHRQKYDAVITAESLQYLKLDKALPLLAEIIKPGGAWVACDYFLTAPSNDHTCHNWDRFQEQITAAGWRISYKRDVTANTLPFLAFLHMLATRFGQPLMDFATLRLRRKQPGLHHILSGVIGQLGDVAADNVSLIDPAQFARDRQYMMLKMERSDAE